MAKKRTARQVASTKPKRLSSPRHLPSWEQRFQELQAFKKENGHCNVPAVYPPNPALGTWAHSVRHAKKKGTLAEDRVRRLDALAFCWDRGPIIAGRWKERIDELKVFKKRHGHCNVPAVYPLDPALAHWVSYARHQKKLGELDQEITRCLDALGFCWARHTAWEQRIHDLKAFKEKHGHCNVPHRYPANPGLGTWVSGVRRRKKLGELATDRILSLDALGFCWERSRRGT